MNQAFCAFLLITLAARFCHGGEAKDPQCPFQGFEILGEKVAGTIRFEIAESPTEARKIGYRKEVSILDCEDIASVTREIVEIGTAPLDGVLIELTPDAVERLIGLMSKQTAMEVVILYEKVPLMILDWPTVRSIKKYKTKSVFFAVRSDDEEGLKRLKEMYDRLRREVALRRPSG